MAFNAVEMADWQISEAAEKNMPTPEEWREKLGLEKEEMLPMGRLAKLDFLKIIDRLKDKPDGKYIEVTAITPTPLGEGPARAQRGPRPVGGGQARGRAGGGDPRVQAGGVLGVRRVLQLTSAPGGRAGASRPRPGRRRRGRAAASALAVRDRAQPPARQEARSGGVQDRGGVRGPDSRSPALAGQLLDWPRHREGDPAAGQAWDQRRADFAGGGSRGQGSSPTRVAQAPPPKDRSRKCLQRALLSKEGRISPILGRIELRGVVLRHPLR